MQISFIGAGKVGVSLGKYFISKGRKVGGYYSLSPKSAAWAANFTNTKQYQSIEEIISSSDMIFFTVPDDKIGEVWEAAKPYAHGKIIAHCSGIHSSNIFSDIDRTGSMAYSIHPLCAVSDRETSWQALGDVLFTSGIFYGAKTILRVWFFNAAGKLGIVPACKRQSGKYPRTGMY